MENIRWWRRVRAWLAARRVCSDRAPCSLTAGEALLEEARRVRELLQRGKTPDERLAPRHTTEKQDEHLRAWLAARRVRDFRASAAVVAGEALLEAARCGDATRVRELLQQGTPPDARRTARHKTALWLAALYGHRQAAALLLAAGADPVADDGLGITPLVGAAVAGHQDVVALMAAVRPDAFNTEAAAIALWRASLAAQAQCVQTMLDGGTPVNIRAPGYPSAIFAAAICDPATLEVLLNAGADPDETDSWGRTALHHAAAAGQRGCAVLLLMAGTDLLARDSAGFTAADVATTGEVQRLLVPGLPVHELPGIGR